MEAVQNCEKLAYEYGNQQIDQEHLLVSLLKLDDSLILKLITKMGISGEQFAMRRKQHLRSCRRYPEADRSISHRNSIKS